MGNTPFKTRLSGVVNDVISSKQMSFKFEGTSRNKPINAYRIDHIELLIESHAGLVTDDYVIAEVDYKDLQGDALANLLSPDSKDYIERAGKIFEKLGTNGNFTESKDPAKIPITLSFKHCYITKSEAYLNLLVHGIAAARDCPMEIWGQYVALNQAMYDKLDKGTTF